MVVLKKIKASTLMETLVATVLIVVVFMMSSMILNNLFSNTIRNNTKDIDAYLNELQYLYINDKLIVPYQEDYKEWQISVVPFNEARTNTVVFESLNSSTKKSVTKSIRERN